MYACRPAKSGQKGVPKLGQNRDEFRKRLEISL
jgi:hypothetical protein